jgi:SNF2 family DNA or RNA helicase
VLTTYDMLRRNIEDILRLRAHAALFDEAHKLSNPGTDTSAAARRLQTRLRFGLTGTLMPNDFKDLHGLMDLLVPNCLGDLKTFNKSVAVPIKNGASKDANDLARVRGDRAKTWLTRLLKERYLLRRDKTQPDIRGQLPAKTEHVVFCRMQPPQARAYARLLACPDLQLLVRGREPCSCRGSTLPRAKCCHKTVAAVDGGVLWPLYHECDCGADDCRFYKPEGCRGDVGAGSGATGGGLTLDCPWCLQMPALTLLGLCSNHLDLLRPERDMGRDPDYHVRRAYAAQCEMARIALGDDADALGGVGAGGASWLNLTDTKHCGKMLVLMQLLRTWHAAGDKVLVFSKSVRMLRIIEEYVKRGQYSHLYFDGSVQGGDRQRIVDLFNTSPSVFVLLASTTAGGVGLNLTAANRVVIFDASWDPSADLQAQDRAYRLGQHRDVHVYRLISVGTIEEMVYKRQIYKQQHTNMVRSKGASSVA